MLTKFPLLSVFLLTGLGLAQKPTEPKRQPIKIFVYDVAGKPVTELTRGTYAIVAPQGVDPLGGLASTPGRMFAQVKVMIGKTPAKIIRLGLLAPLAQGSVKFLVPDDIPPGRDVPITLLGYDFEGSVNVSVGRALR